MADTTQGDTDFQYLGLPALALIALIAGQLIHSFIIGVNISDWWEGRSVTAVDHIITSLGISRMGVQFINTLSIFMVKTCLTNMNSYITPILGFIYDFFTYANFWLTSLLSIVFCLKISNFHSRLFLYLRGMIMHRTGHLIVASAFISIVNSFLSVLGFTKLINVEVYNTTMNNYFTGCISIGSVHIYVIGVSFPLLSYCISSVFLFSSLYHHTIKMKRSSNLSLSLEKYYSAMRFVSFTFIYNTLYFIGHFAFVFYYYFYCVTLPWLHIFLDMLPLLHSSYLIYRTAKLRSPMSKVLQNVSDFLFQRKDTETRENIEVVV